jgi:DNA-3-methyladenine glycosylase II
MASMQPGSFTITPTGPFSLAEAATFGFGQRAGASWDGVMRLAFCLDGYADQVGVEVRQDQRGTQDEAGQPDGTGTPGGAGTVRCVVHGPAGADLNRVRDQVARVLSLDHDGREFTRVGERDPVIGRLQAVAPGLRPPLFYSPYEAAAWCVLSARRPARQMMQARDRLSHAHGQVFDLAGEQLAALPTPGQLLAIDSFPGIPADRMPRLHGVARAALDGRLDAAWLLDQGPERAMAGLQALDGIGPFYSSLIVIRGTGFTDVLPVNEPRVLDLAGRLYQLGGPPSEAEFRRLAQPWKPLRTWAAVLIRAAAARLLGEAGTGQAGAPAGVR